MATHSSILAWRTPWTWWATYSSWGRKESDMTEMTEHAVTTTLRFRQGQRVPARPSSYTPARSGSVNFDKDKTRTQAAHPLTRQHFHHMLHRAESGQSPAS